VSGEAVAQAVARFAFLDQPAHLATVDGRDTLAEQCQQEVGPAHVPNDGMARRTAQFGGDDFLEGAGIDPAGGNGLAILGGGEKRLTTECISTRYHRLFEGQVFEGVEGVVVDEDADRPLGRQQVGGVFYGRLQ
jgi:hypothetical protein